GFTRAEYVAKAHCVIMSQARVQLAGRGEAQAIAVIAEMLGHRGDDAELARGLGGQCPVPSGTAVAWPSVSSDKRTERRLDGAADRRGGDAARAVVQRAVGHRHVLDEPR